MTSMSDEYNNNIVIANEYVLGRLISSGGFGSVHYGYSLNTQQVVAIKLENSLTTKHDYLKNEYEIIKQLNTPIDGFNMHGIPNIYWFGKQNDYTVMVMDLLGMNIELLNVNVNKLIKQHEKMEHVLSLSSNEHLTNQYIHKLKCILMLKILFKLLSIIEHLHKQGYIHKDIKPQNILINCEYNIKQGLLNSLAPEIYIVDFGLTEKLYTNEGEHITKRRTGKFAGTIKYMSLNTHDGIQQSRIDDLESFMYLMLHVFDIKFPWSNIDGKGEDKKCKKERIMKIKEMKKNVNYTTLCKGVILSEIFDDVIKLVNYIRDLSFYSIPDYLYMKKLLVNAHTSLKSTI